MSMLGGGYHNYLQEKVKRQSTEESEVEAFEKGRSEGDGRGAVR